MPTTRSTIFIFPEAPAKPEVGAACNGCGVCCLLEPCPLGVVLSGRRHGACLALRWQADQQQYRCGAITEPQALLSARLPSWGRFLAPGLAKGLGRWAKRWVAAGMGCDCEAQVDQPSAPADQGAEPR